MRGDGKGTAAVLGAALGYATLPVIAKLAFDAGVRVWPLLAWRFALAATVVWMFVAATGRSVPAGGDRRTVIALGGLYAGNALAFMVGLQWVPAATASLIFFVYPAVVVLLARLFLAEPLSARRVTSLGLALAGCALTIGGGLGGGEPLGIGLILAAVGLISVFILRSSHVLPALPGFASSAIILTTTAAISIVLSLATGGIALGGGTRGAVLVALLGVVGTAFPVTFFLLGVQRIGAGRAAIYSTVEPAVTVGLAALLLGERIGATQMVGGILILCGVLWLRLERRLDEEPAPLEAP